MRHRLLRLRIATGKSLAPALLCAVTLVGCGGGDNPVATSASPTTTSPAPTVPPPAAPARPQIDFSPHTVVLSWPRVAGATSYTVVESSGGIDTEVATTSDTRVRHRAALFKKTDASYSVRACAGSHCSDASTQTAVADNLSKLTENGISSIVAPDGLAGDEFGWSVVLSGDGNTMAVGAVAKAHEGQDDAGMVYLYTRNPATQVWQFQAAVTASNAGAGNNFGTSIALSADGNTLVVGASHESAAFSQSIAPQTVDTRVPDSGAVYVYRRNTSNNAWPQVAYLKADNGARGDRFGTVVSLSADGRTLAVGAEGRDTRDTTGARQDDSGAAYIFSQDPATSVWTQRTMLVASNPKAGDQFGNFLALSADGKTLAVGAVGESSPQQATADNITDQSAPFSGAAYVFTESAGTLEWEQRAFLKSPGGQPHEYFGQAIAISANGDTIAVGAWNRAFSDDLPGSGMAFVFHKALDGLSWVRTADLKANRTRAGDAFGSSVALSADGTTLAIGAPYESSNATGIQGISTTTDATQSGAVHLFTMQGNGSWKDTAYIKGPTVLPGGQLAYWKNLSLASDGNTLAVGAPSVRDGERSDQPGAVYVY